VTVSSRVRVAWNEPGERLPTFVLYEDELQALGPTDNDAGPVYLRLVGVSVELCTLAGGGATVTVALPRRLAGELGLLHLRPGAAGEPGGRTAK
jgi:hypothetical protein